MTTYKSQVHAPFRLDHDYDERNADTGTRSRYGNYLNHRRGTFEDIVGFGYDDPSVEFAATVWRIATGPIMAPPFVVSPQRVLDASVQRSDWNGEAVVDVTLIADRPAALRNATTVYLYSPAGVHYRDWPTNFSGEYEPLGDQDLVRAPYLLTRSQVLLQLPPGTLPHVTDIPTTGQRLLDHAIECLNVLVRELNRELGPLLDQMDGRP